MHYTKREIESNTIFSIIPLIENTARRVYKEQQQLEEGQEQEETSPPWSESEDVHLRGKFTNFIKKSAAIHQRPYAAIVSRIKQIYDEKH